MALTGSITPAAAVYPSSSSLQPDHKELYPGTSRRKKEVAVTTKMTSCEKFTGGRRTEVGAKLTAGRSNNFVVNRMLFHSGSFLQRGRDR